MLPIFTTDTNYEPYHAMSSTMDIDSEQNRIRSNPSPFARRAEGYTYRVPTPPRVLVPPPTINPDTALPDFTLSAIPNKAFLPKHQSGNLINQNVIVDWSYHRRREAQMILPHLYLGPMTIAKDRTFLSKTGITLVIGLRHIHNPPSTPMPLTAAVRTAEDLGIESEIYDVSSNQDLIRFFPQINNLILSHLSQVHAKYTAQQTYSSLQSDHSQPLPEHGKVLLFCESGNERSAAATAAHLMATHIDVDHVRAMQFVQAQRFCVVFDDAMKRLLQGYWDMVQAERDCAGQPRRVTGKRTLDPEDEMSEHGGFGLDNTGMGADPGGAFATAGAVEYGGSMYADDRARFEGRHYQPFVEDEPEPQQQQFGWGHDQPHHHNTVNFVQH